MKYVVKRELYHHGINGQKWGVQNGPPYPLDYEDHSAEEKKENSKSIIDGVSGEQESKADKKRKNQNRFVVYRRTMRSARKAAVVTGLADLGLQFVRSKMKGESFSLNTKEFVSATLVGAGAGFVKKVIENKTAERSMEGGEE